MTHHEQYARHLETLDRPTLELRPFVGADPDPDEFRDATDPINLTVIHLEQVPEVLPRDPHQVRGLERWSSSSVSTIAVIQAISSCALNRFMRLALTQVG